MCKSLNALAFRHKLEPCRWRQLPLGASAWRSDAAMPPLQGALHPLQGCGPDRLKLTGPWMPATSVGTTARGRVALMEEASMRLLGQAQIAPSSDTCPGSVETPDRGAANRVAEPVPPSGTGLEVPHPPFATRLRNVAENRVRHSVAVPPSGPARRGRLRAPGCLGRISRRRRFDEGTDGPGTARYRHTPR